MTSGAGEGDSPKIVTVVGRNIELKWHPATFLLEMSFIEKGCVSTGEDAQWMIQTTNQFTAGCDRVGTLVDCHRLAKTDARWRAVLAEHSRTISFRNYIAWYNASLLIRVTTQMFTIVSPIIGKAFAHEADARAWLRKAGIG